MVKRTITAAGLRPLTREDMTTLLQPIHRHMIVSPDRIRESHHRVARLSAAGLKNTEIADKTGYSTQRVSQLLDSPAMKDLVTTYREMVNTAFISSTKEEYDLGRETWRKAQRLRLDKLEAAEIGEIDIPLRELSAIAADGEDRYGVTKKSTNINLNADFAAELEAALSRSAKVIDQSVIEVEATPTGIRRRV